jgi:hypothetical protein
MTVDSHRQEAQIRYDNTFQRQISALQKAEDARQKYEVFKKVSGHEAEEAHRQLIVLSEREKLTKAAWRQSGEAKDQANRNDSAERQKVEDQEKLCAQSESARETAVSRFRTFAQTGVLVELRIPGGESAAEAAMTTLIDMARYCDDLIPESRRTDKEWTQLKNRQTEKFEILKAGLSAQNLPTSMEIREDVHIIEVTYNGDNHRIDRIQEKLATDVEFRRRLLTEKERELLENHLVDEVADHLHRRLHEAQALVRNMNAELENRRTSTGMKFEFKWSVPEGRGEGDPDSYVWAACAILARRSATWTDEDRRDLAQFLQARIQSFRNEDESVAWLESVAHAVDYRPWHNFQVRLWQDNIWKPLTKKTHGTGSGGEKALALTIPLFAAAAAHYHNASLAPRLIMLDEAFAGIDREMVSECMGLLAKFDLDFVMTSEREWGTYPTIDGLSICWLSTLPTQDAVDISRWRWDGSGERYRVDASPSLPRNNSPKDGAP